MRQVLRLRNVSCWSSQEDQVIILLVGFQLWERPLHIDDLVWILWMVLDNIQSASTVVLENVIVRSGICQRMNCLWKCFSAFSMERMRSPVEHFVGWFSYNSPLIHRMTTGSTKPWLAESFLKGFTSYLSRVSRFGRVCLTSRHSRVPRGESAAWGQCFSFMFIHFPIKTSSVFVLVMHVCVMHICVVCHLNVFLSLF